MLNKLAHIRANRNISRFAPHRILCVPSGIGFSHLGRLLLISERLREQGCEIHFAYGGPHKDIFNRLKYNWYPVKEIQMPERQGFNGPILERYTEAIIDECVHDELKIIEKFKPDAIIMDLRPTVSLSARLAGVPCISILNACMTDYFDVTGLFVDQKKFPLKYKIISKLQKMYLHRRKKSLAIHFRAVGRHYGIKDKLSLHDFLSGNLNLIADLIEFAPMISPPSNYVYAGPMIWEDSNKKRPDILNQRSATKKLIYATTGYTGSAQLLDLVTETFSGRDDFQVIMTTGQYIDPTPYRGHPNIHVEQFIPGSEVMPMSDVVIHCGTSGTTYQTLANGLPAIVIPYNNEQRINAYLIQRHRIGISMLAKQPDRHNLLASVQYLFDKQNKFYSPLQRFQYLLHNSDGPGIAADKIEAFLRPKFSGRFVHKYAESKSLNKLQRQAS